MQDTPQGFIFLRHTHAQLGGAIGAQPGTERDADVRNQFVVQDVRNNAQAAEGGVDFTRGHFKEPVFNALDRHDVNVRESLGDQLFGDVPLHNAEFFTAQIFKRAELWLVPVEGDHRWVGRIRFRERDKFFTFRRKINRRQDVQLARLEHLQQFDPSITVDVFHLCADFRRDHIQHIDGKTLGRAVLSKIERWPVGFVANLENRMILQPNTLVVTERNRNLADKLVTRADIDIRANQRRHLHRRNGGQGFAENTA